jgi:hypothetical protein
MGLVVAMVVVCLLGHATFGDGIRSIGLRVVLPIGNTPFLLGLEASGDVAFGVATGSFFLSADGKTLITISCDLPFGGGEAGARTFVRLTTGLVYFDRTHYLPSLLVGGGLAFEVPVSSFLAVAAAGEFIYPFAFPVPMVSASGRWVLP